MIIYLGLKILIKRLLINSRIHLFKFNLEFILNQNKKKHDDKSNAKAISLSARVDKIIHLTLWSE